MIKLRQKPPEVDVYALPRTRAELDEAVRRARSLVNRRAALASATVLVPIPAFDLAADVGTLVRLIPEINRYFGLTPDQIALVAEQPIPPGTTNTEALGDLLYTDYFYLFQVAGLILLVAIIGAITLTLRHRDVHRQSIAIQVHRRREEALELRKIQPGGGI